MKVLLFQTKGNKRETLRTLNAHGPEIPMVNDIYYIREDPFVVVRRIWDLDSSMFEVFVEMMPYNAAFPRPMAL